jgi:Na+/phosphate symporter
LAHSLNYLTEPMFEHINNNHKPLLDVQHDELKELSAMVDIFFNSAIFIVKEDRFDQIDELIMSRNNIIDNLMKIEKNQLKRIKTQQVNSRNSMLFLNMVVETKNMLLHTINLLKSHRDFIVNTTNKD